MNYEKIKQEIKEIVEITASVPAEFQGKCFEILLQRLLDDNVQVRDDGKKDDVSTVVTPPTPPSNNKIPTPATVKVFMQRTGVVEDDLNSIMLYEDGNIHFIKEPSTNVVAQGQIEWSLLLALKKAILSNEFITDPEDVRSVCKDKGFYDVDNFAGNFKKAANASLFKSPLVPQGEAQPLSNDGQIALGKLVKSLAGKGQ